MTTHYDCHAGKRRCLTLKMPLDHHLALQEHREFRLRTSNDFIPDDETIHIGVIFHFFSTNHNHKLTDMIPQMQKIMSVMNGCFSHTFSPLVDFHKIENGSFINGSAHHKTLYNTYKDRAKSANIRFLLADTPSFHHIKDHNHKHEGTDADVMQYWDKFLKQKTSPAQEPHRLYNIYVVNGVKSVLLGYGNFPKINPTAQETAVDGFVYFTSSEPYHLHVTAVHETGHVFSLRHPFNHDPEENDFDDGIDDTPYQKAPDYGPIWEKKGPWPHSDKNGQRFFHGIPNYMNYVNDDSMFMFTAGQVKRMRETASTIRRGWVLSPDQVNWLERGSPYPFTSSAQHQRLLDPSTMTLNQRNQDPESKENFLLVETNGVNKPQPLVLFKETKDKMIQDMEQKESTELPDEMKPENIPLTDNPFMYQYKKQVTPLEQEPPEARKRRLQPPSLHTFGGRCDTLAQVWDSLSQNWTWFQNLGTLVAAGQDTCCSV